MSFKNMALYIYIYRYFSLPEPIQQCPAFPAPRHVLKIMSVQHACSPRLRLDWPTSSVCHVSAMVDSTSCTDSISLKIRYNASAVDEIALIAGFTLFGPPLKNARYHNCD